MGFLGASLSCPKSMSTLTPMNSISVRKLDCGMGLVVEQMNNVRSASMSWLTPAGCISDPDELEGITPLLEEMLLRGSAERSSREEADLFDRLGASRDVEAGTYTMRFDATCMGERMGDVLAPMVDMVVRPRLDEEGLEPSRELCLAAIASLKDDPQQRASLLARERHHPKPINRTGMGTEAGLGACSRNDLVLHWARFAKPAQSILAIAGNVNVDVLERQLNKLLVGWNGAAPEVKTEANAPRGYAHEPDPSSQVQIIVAYDAPAESDSKSTLEKFAVSVLSGGMSGRLFSEVREKRGLCYSVGAAYRGDKTFGGVSAYVGTTPERSQESLDVLLSELSRITTADGKVSPEEFHRAKVGLKSSLVFSGESTAARAATLAADVRRLGKPRSLEDAASEIENVTLDQLNAYLATRTLGKMTIQTLGASALKV